MAVKANRLPLTSWITALRVRHQLAPFGTCTPAECPTQGTRHLSPRLHRNPQTVHRAGPPHRTRRVLEKRPETGEQPSLAEPVLREAIEGRGPGSNAPWARSHGAPFGLTARFSTPPQERLTGHMNLVPSRSNFIEQHNAHPEGWRDRPCEAPATRVAQRFTVYCDQMATSGDRQMEQRL